MKLDSQNVLPVDAANALLVGRLWQPGVGPTVVVCHHGALYDVTGVAPTTSQLFEMDALATTLRKALPGAPKLAELASVLANCDESTRDPDRPWLLAPCDLQAIKASGVTFVASMLERVIEERARGNPDAVILVTPNWNPGGQGGLYHDHPIGVYYCLDRWAIFNQDMAPMPLGAAFNVWIG